MVVASFDSSVQLVAKLHESPNGENFITLADLMWAGSGNIVSTFDFEVDVICGSTWSFKGCWWVGFEVCVWGCCISWKVQFCKSWEGDVRFTIPV